jgi:hypothetical protein
MKGSHVMHGHGDPYTVAVHIERRTVSLRARA